MTAEIKADHVSLRLGKQNVLSDLSFQLKGDKIYGLLGRNGAGKTSLLSLLASFREPTEGTILINGEIPFENDRVMSRVNFVYGRDQSSETEKVKGMLEFAERYRPNWDGTYALKLVKRFKLPMDQKVNALSKGKQSALDVVIGLASRTPVTIFDEAYLGMDAPSRSIFYEELIKDYAEHPRCMILSTHLISEVASLMEEVMIIDRGTLILHESVDSLMAHGLSVTGPVEQVDALTRDLHVLKEQQLGRTKSVMIYGQLESARRSEFEAAGLELGPISLQELFIYLTEHEGEEA
ncbi:ABC transporter ATP-binding protein [Sporolactobacillus terrae]|uniref:ABC transporter n=1 Tax=Sporolactobacillus terrae TaxID=269673 RepID=A0ABX5Q562_9BACL|nr:ABC transporter ATP-binding protein [Sporolactobacillus terrae]QAA21774.1 ABC transporter [Sporolactobacillus terrae]QAA24747.1 ABC transporter [Sporolactobacillus terrae]UAK16576.1 ABC transporter ATP-binding protein [Sporolactobacillus terrae]